MLDVMSVQSPKLQTAFLLWEINQAYCRESGVLLAGSGAKRELEIGTITGKITDAGTFAAAAAAHADNAASTGAMTLATPATGAGVVAGVYTAICIEPASDAGTFEVFDPEGVSIGTATVGVAFDGVVKFTIADGSTNFIAGEGFDITVTKTASASAGKIVAWDPTATDGSEVVEGVTIARAVAQDGTDGTITRVTTGPLLGKLDGIVWPDGATTDQKTAAIAALKALGIRFAA